MSNTPINEMSIEEMLEAVCEPVGDKHEVDLFVEIAKRYKELEREIQELRAQLDETSGPTLAIW